MNEAPNAVLERAIELAVVSHAGQADKNGEAYILHPLRVMLAVRERGGTIEQQGGSRPPRRDRGLRRDRRLPRSSVSGKCL